MKKILLAVIVVLCALLLWDLLAGAAGLALIVDDYYVGDVEGPLGALAALALAGGSVVLGLVAMLLAGLLLAVVFAGVGILVVAAVALAALLAAALASPLLLVLLLPLALLWLLVGRARQNRPKSQSV